MVAPRLGSTYATAAEACCACGALHSESTLGLRVDSVASPPGALFNLDTRTNPLAA